MDRRSRRKSKTLENEKEQRRSILIDRILGEDEDEDHHDASGEEEDEISPGIEESASQMSREDAMKLIFSNSSGDLSSDRNRLDSDLSSQASVISFKSSVLDDVPKKKKTPPTRVRRASYLSRHANSPRVDRRKSTEISKSEEVSVLQLKREHRRKLAVSTYKILRDAIESLILNAPKPNETQSYDVVDEILSQLEIIARLGESVSGTLHLGSVMPVRNCTLFDRSFQNTHAHTHTQTDSIHHEGNAAILSSPGTTRTYHHPSIPKRSTHSKTNNIRTRQVRYAVMRATRHIMCTLEDLDVSLKFGVATFAALSMQRPEIELRWERVEALKLVQQMIKIVYVAQSSP